MSAQLNCNSNKKIQDGFFVTGTDTNVGKTLVAAGLTLKLIEQGKKVSVIKPVASGCYKNNDRLVSEDALILRECSSNPKEIYSSVNPYAFYEPIAPHLAAQKLKLNLSTSRILEKSQPVLNSDDDYVVIEGAGGWLTPISDAENISDLAKSYGYPVVLVVGIRLGAINHALLTYEHMHKSGIKIAGWVANIIDQNMLYPKENISAIEGWIDASLLGVIPYQQFRSPEKFKEFISI